MARLSKGSILGTVPFVGIVIIWQLASSMQWFPKWFYPSPWETVQAFTRLIRDGTLIQIVSVSVGNVLPAFLLGFLVAVVVGMLIGINPTARRTFFPLLSALYPVPSLAWLPLWLLLFGFTRLTILAVIVFSTFIRTVYIVIGGVRAANKNWVLVAQNLGFSKADIIIQVILPGALPHIMTAARMGFGNAWRSLIAAEMLVATVGGLGRFIWYSQWYFNYANVLVGILTIAAIGVVAEQLVFKRLERATLIRWGVIRESSVENTGGW